MKTIIALSPIILVLSVLGADQVCEINQHGFKVCKKSNVITQITNNEGRESCTLHLENNTIIGSNAFININISELWLILPEYNSPSLLSLQPNSFMGLEHLTILHILDANISSNGNPWAQLKNLQMLKCISCGFTQVPTKILSSLSKLEVLELMGNAIHKIQRNSFVGLNNLTYLSLNRNGRMVLEAEGFRGLNKLTELDLSSNSLTLMPGGFDGLDQLAILYISGIFDSNITLSNAFRGMPALNRLELANSDLNSLHPGMFDDLLALRTLRLYLNKLHHVPKNVFNKLKSLEDLSLADNNITTIEPGAFSGLNLEKLHLNSNEELSVIETGAFGGLSVGYLGLSSCNISQLKPQAFNGLTAAFVDLGHNQLTIIGTEDFVGLETGILFLNYNNVTAIMSGAFNNTKVESIRVDEDLLTNANKTNWGLPESVDID